MDILLYNLFNSQWFWIVVAIWGIVAFASEKRKALAKRILFLISRTPIDKDDPDEMHENEGFFPGRILRFFAIFLDRFKNYITEKKLELSDSDNPVSFLAYFILLVAFCAFALADWIAIANGLSTFFAVDLLLTPFVIAGYGLAVGIATFLSLIIGFFVLYQAKNDDPIMRWGEDTERDSRKLAQRIAFVIVGIALLVGLFIGFQKLTTLGIIAQNSFIDFIAQFGVHVMILINGSLSAGLIFMEALFGVLVLALGVAWIIVILLTIGRHLLDFAIRSIIIGIDLITYYIFTPIIGFVELVRGVFGGIS